MEDVLELYHKPYDPQQPVVCFDEGTKQLIGERWTRLPMQPGAPQRYDYSARSRLILLQGILNRCKVGLYAECHPVRYNRNMRFFNMTGPCNPIDHYMLPATARLEGFDIDRLLAPDISQRTTTESATTPGGRAVTVIRA